jgi:hypothetical protein
MIKSRVLFSALCATLLVPQFAHAQKFTDFMPGQNLDGWTRRGGNASYAMDGKELVGKCVLNTPNSFLCSERTFSDFILEYDFKVDPTLNSGVQIRSECFDQKTQVTWRGKSIDIPAKRVHGYQIEIDPDPTRNRWWTAGLYDEGQRDWLFPGSLGGDPKAFTEAGRKLFKPGDWNHIRVEAIGDSIKTWLNGKPCVDTHDSFVARGFIGLQVHGIGNDKTKEGAEVRFRNMRIADMTPRDNTVTKSEVAAGWQLLWDGKTTKGWRGAKLEGFPTKGWEISDGVLTVLGSGGAESAGGGDIVTTNLYSQFEMTVDFKITAGANSGVKYFTQTNLDPITTTGQKATTGSAIGLEFQILDDERHPDAKLGRDGDRTVGSLYDLIPAVKTKRTNPVGAWNTARILVQGSHVEHWLNGMKVLDYERGSEAYRALVAASKYKSIPGFGEWPEGHILLQEHGDRVSFKNIKIREIK